MKHSKLAEYVEGQVAKGVSLLDIEQYLRRQGWEDEVINQVLAPHRPLPVADTRIKTSAKKLGRLVWLLVAAIGALALLGAYKGCQKLALAKEIRE
jgi:hypothetical protein